MNVEKKICKYIWISQNYLTIPIRDTLTNLKYISQKQKKKASKNKYNNTILLLTEIKLSS